MKYDILNITLSVTANCIVFLYFLFAPFRSRFRYSYFKTAMLAVLLIGITSAITILFLTPHGPLFAYDAVGILLWMLCAILTFRITIKGSFFEVLFIILVVLNLYVNIAVIAKVLMITLHLDIADSLLYAAFTIAISIACIPLIWILLGKLYRQIVEFNMEFAFWKFIWVIPALMYLIFFTKLIPDYWHHPMNVGTSDIVFAIIWTITTYVVFFVTLLMLIQSYNGVTAKQQTELIASQLKMQANQYERLLENIESTARLRHDWRHHLLSIKGFAETNQIEALLNYLKELNPAYLNNDEHSVCQNHIVDVILQHYAAIAREHSIDLTIAANVPRSLTIADTDLCVIFGNLIENAVEACARQEHGDKRIEIKVEAKGHQLALMIKNTYQENIVHRGEACCSAKHDGGGIGLSSVSRIVKKNHGKMKISYNKTQFKVYALFDIYL